MSATVSTATEGTHQASTPDAVPQALPEVRKRRHSRYDKNPKRGPVNVERFLEEGVERVRVPLYGRGYGHSMVLDATDWDNGRADKGWPECWILGGVSRTRPGYVMTGQKPVSGLARQPGGGIQVAVMGRLIMGAQPGEIVEFADGNPLNLRRSNMCKLGRGAAARRRAELRATGVIS